MKITFLGAARTVTGSMHWLEINGHNLLLDCGMFQGKDAYEVNNHFDFDPAQIEAVILSHAHIDHSGNLPSLVKKGFRGKIFSTKVTMDIAELLMADSARIQEADAEYLNQQNHRRGQPAVKPLYTSEDAEKVSEYFVRMEYNNTFEPVPGVTARLIEAGHILGSAAVVLDIEEANEGKTDTFRFWYSGDIGRWRLPIVRDPVLPKDARYLLMECTYGDKSHPDIDAAFQQLRTAVIATIKRGGKVIIPAFAVGRTQDLVYEFHRMFEAGDLPRVPIYVDSPLAVRTSEVFQKNPQAFDREAKELQKESDSGVALGFDLLTYVQSVDESKQIIERDEPMIIISASGMADSGRIVHHLAHGLGNPRNTVLLVSYQAPDTVGRALANGDKQIELFGELFERKCDVVVLGGFSAHAGQSMLEEYALSSKDTIEEIFLVHGEEEQAETLQKKLQQAGIQHVLYPYPKQVVTLPRVDADAVLQAANLEQPKRRSRKVSSSQQKPGKNGRHAQPGNKQQPAQAAIPVTGQSKSSKNGKHRERDEEKLDFPQGSATKKKSRSHKPKQVPEEKAQFQKGRSRKANQPQPGNE